MPRMPGTRFVVPRAFSQGRPDGPPRFIVIHYTAGSESPTAAEDGAAYDQRRRDGTSSHFFTDRNSIVQCCDTNDRANTARYHGNQYGIQIEQCGTLQTRAQWLDDASRETIRNTAKVCAWAMETHNIPLARLVSRQVRTGRGICGHVDCTTGFPEDDGDHTDPGTAYPWDVLFADITELLGTEEDMPLTPDDITKIVKAVHGHKVQGDWLSAGVATDQTYRYLTKGGEIRGAIQTIAGSVTALSATVKALAERQGIDHTALMAEVDALEEGLANIQVGDPAEVAAKVAAALGPLLTPQLLDALNARLVS